MINIGIINKSEMVAEYIKSKIEKNEWNSGDKIDSETELCKVLGVSRVSVRAGIDKLVALEILEKKNAGRTYVKKVGVMNYFESLNNLFTLEEIDHYQIADFRNILEVKAVKLFVTNGSLEEKRKLEKTYENMLKNKNNENFYFYDYEFHKIIAKGTGNKIIEKIYDILFSILGKQQSYLFEKVGPKGGIKFHKLILDAVKDNDVELASLYMERHLKDTRNDLEKLKIEKGE